jgi:hypothetical protein
MARRGGWVQEPLSRSALQAAASKFKKAPICVLRQDEAEGQNKPRISLHIA